MSERPEFLYINVWRDSGGDLESGPDVFTGADQRKAEARAFMDAMNEYDGIRYDHTIRQERVAGGWECRRLDFSDDLQAFKEKDRQMRQSERRQHSLKHEEMV